jgi:hypothetical protein
MKLITELNEEIKFITEASESGKRNLFIEGIFMQSERPNRNGRMYSFDILNREATRYVNEFVSKGRAFGELGHPDGPTINLERTALLIKELKADKTDFYGKAKILDTPYGNIVKNLIEEGATLGVSTRGMGTLEENKEGIKVVKDDFYLATAADIVADPSAPDAFVRGVMENKEWVFVEGRWIGKHIEETKRVIQKTSSKNLEEVKLKVFEAFLKSL